MENKKTLLVLMLLILAGCSSGPQQTCSTKECFISAANTCSDVGLTLSGPAGVFTYRTTTDCVFTKTLVTTNVNETQDMKNLLQGKSMTCKYQKGAFDSRWVTSLIFGTEYCTGDLKNALAELIAFT